jgi:tRNA-2-methylthio-N6-dimethylallyladenosine synthase
VLVSGTDRKQQHLSGLTEGKIIVRFASDNKGLVGLFVDVEITSAAEFAVEGKLVKVYQEDLQQA